MSLRAGRVVGAWVILPLVLASFLSFQPAYSGDRPGVSEITLALRRIEAQEPGRSRSDSLVQLAMSLHSTGNAGVTQDDIESLARMMRDDDDSLRFWAAAMLGNIGAPAQSATPALKAALADRPCENKTLTSAVAIRLALEKLGEQTSRMACPSPGDVPAGARP
ncbi:hypothetical protein [Caulobacter sp. CCG-8]|uniref:hypothetical protein n=1 Tax=Caulobacter sp. CCG-8 TaxID=3127958 RepID=UPI00307D6436